MVREYYLRTTLASLWVLPPEPSLLSAQMRGQLCLEVLITGCCQSQLVSAAADENLRHLAYSAPAQYAHIHILSGLVMLLVVVRPGF